MADELKVTARRPFGFGRVQVRELLPPDGATALPPRHRPRTPTFLYGDRPNQRKQRGLQPLPPRRERPPDVEALDTGERLYGAHPLSERVLTFRPIARVATVPTDTAGDKLAYRPAEGHSARQVSVRLQPSAGATAMIDVILRRGGSSHVLWSTAAALFVDASLTLEDRDELVVAVSAAGAGGESLTAGIFGEEQR